MLPLNSSIIVVFETIMSQQQKSARLEWEVTGCHWSKVNEDETEDEGHYKLAALDVEVLRQWLIDWHRRSVVLTIFTGLVIAVVVYVAAVEVCGGVAREQVPQIGLIGPSCVASLCLALSYISWRGDGGREKGLCEHCQVPESVEHIICHCQNYTLERHMLKRKLGVEELNLTDVLKLGAGQVLQYLKLTGLSNRI